jgi:hypothetical protein
MDEELQWMEEANVRGPSVEMLAETKATQLKFLFAKKLGADGKVERGKAQLVFVNKDKGANWNELYAPVINKTSLQTFLMFVAIKK